MKIAPVSADLLIKLGLALGLGLGVWYLGRKVVNAVGGTVNAATGAVSEAASKVVDTVAVGVHAVDPRNDENVIYRGVNWATGGDDSNSLGGRIADFFHPTKI